MISVERTGLPSTILFVDICDSTSLYETIGNVRAQSLIAKTLSMFSSSVTSHAGTIVKTIGDGIMCQFSVAANALKASVAMQQYVKQTTGTRESDAKRLAIRIGLHYGRVITQGADLFGDAVNIASHVVARARPGQILISKQTVRVLPRQTSVRFSDRTHMKGKKAALELYEVVWDHRDVTDVQRVEPERPSARLAVKFRNETIELGHDRPIVQMGRGPENDIVVSDPLASRVHARIERRNDRFVLIDQSLNGTYLRMSGRTAVVLRRSEIGLEGSGVICLGESYPRQDRWVRFAIQTGH